ncbi:amidoligase family protein [Bacteriovorax sp. Seq25_V]|uniref:amidoligase family protein n=1 Tax=Bacteriovorax sp. Seq25_V TaxID=1201288 RepID=UPI000389DABB|nr:amidoligase family protein [Bacteriovorax sp. Seq25_V]EQC44196.1 hypothetical protein M900_A0420 [Bacteriovorax sp. Seq25_V]
MSKNKVSKLAAYLSLSGMMYNCSHIPGLGRDVSSEGFVPQTAYEAWGTLNHSATSYQATALFVEEGVEVPGMGSGVSWGAEKEASSSLVTRVMGPPPEVFKGRLETLTPDNQELFLRDFLGNYKKDANGYRTFKNEQGLKVDLARDVVDAEGNPKLIDLSKLKALDVENASLEELTAVFDDFLAQTDGRPMSFIKPQIRMKMFNGNLPGLDGKFFATTRNYRGAYQPNYNLWVPNFGKAQKYLINAHGHNGGVGGGWEMNFVPLSTYGEFEEMVSWFRNELSQVIKDPYELERKVKLFQAPGHQRMVFTKHSNLPADKLAELYRMVQTYIVLSGVQGNTGIEFANFKKIVPDSDLKSLDARYDRGVIRVEGDRWAPNTLGIEFRAGTKDLDVARFYQTVLAARVTANDYDGLAGIDDYSLYNNKVMDTKYISQKTGALMTDVAKAKAVLDAVGIKEGYRIQLWDWTHKKVPYLSSTKKSLLRTLTKDYIERVAKIDPNSPNAKESVRALGREWTRASRLTADIENYMRPKRKFTYSKDVLNFKVPEGRQLVSEITDVNKIDLGIEYSGKFPLAVRGDFSKDRLEDGKRAWIQTKVDLSSEEREAIIKKVAMDLKRELKGVEGPTKVDSDGHGHGLDVSYTIRDSKNRKWIVEWDGIGRSYTPEGEIIEGSSRGGSIELVTPKFTPELNEMNAVYKAFEANNILPQLTSGGGHINIDLAAFDGKPKELARFLSVFHEHRSVISLMFQHVARSHTSEQLDLSNNLVQALKNFDGTEDELKKLLYNERYFNTRFGRKSRYVQLDLSAYYQDIIPEEFITDDFDISNPTTPWRRQFRVDPKIRKAEFRMFNAPRDAMESALQVKLVRAMLSKALNETEPVGGKVAMMTHKTYLADQNKAFSDLEKMCNDLGLDINEYRPAVAEGLAETEKTLRSPFYVPLNERLKNNPHQKGWGNASDARPADQSLASEGRAWEPGPADQYNTMTNEHRVEAARKGQQMRNGIVPARELPYEFVKTQNCTQLINSIL